MIIKGLSWTLIILSPSAPPLAEDDIAALGVQNFQNVFKELQISAASLYRKEIILCVMSTSQQIHDRRVTWNTPAEATAVCRNRTLPENCRSSPGWSRPYPGHFGRSAPDSPLLKQINNKQTLFEEILSHFRFKHVGWTNTDISNFRHSADWQHTDQLYHTSSPLYVNPKPEPNH